MNIRTFRFLLLVLVLNTLGLSSKGQSHDSKDIENEEIESRHIIGLMFGYAWVPQTISDGEEAIVIIPAIGLDYGFSITHRFGLVFVNDIELSSYLIQDENGSELQRDNKYIGAITALYHVTPVIGLFAGPGVEFEHNKSFAIIKLGFDLAKHFDEGWAIAFNMSVDINNSYETYSTGLVISKYL